MSKELEKIIVEMRMKILRDYVFGKDLLGRMKDYVEDYKNEIKSKED